jgi:hypothetical protein
MISLNSIGALKALAREQPSNGRTGYCPNQRGSDWHEPRGPLKLYDDVRYLVRIHPASASIVPVPV